MSEGTQRVLDTACAVTALTAELVMALLLHYRTLTALGRRLASSVLQQRCGHHGLILLQGADQAPQGWTVVSHHGSEGVVPTCADVVRSFAAGQGGVVHVPYNGGIRRARKISLAIKVPAVVSRNYNVPELS